MCRQLRANSIKYADKKMAGTVGFLSCRQMDTQVPISESW